MAYGSDTAVQQCARAVADSRQRLTTNRQATRLQSRFILKRKHIPQGECRMAKVGAGEALASSFDGVSTSMALTAIALCFTSNISAHGGGLNFEGCHHNRKRGGYRCHRGGGASLRSDAALTNRLAPLRISPLRVSRGPSVFANCAAPGAAPVRCGGPGYGPHLGRDGNGVACEPRLR